MGLPNGEFQFHGREVTLLKNQMKSAMMAKPADKNIQSGNSRVKVTIYGQVNRAIRFANTGDKYRDHEHRQRRLVLAPRHPRRRQGQRRT